MSLNCFFGVGVTSGEPVEPPIPADTILFLSQACVSAESRYAGAITLYAEACNAAATSGAAPADGKVALCTLHPGHGIFHCPLQLLFTGAVKLTLEGPKNAGGAEVHVTGYYEAADAGGYSDAGESESDESVEMPPPRRTQKRVRA